MSRPTTSPPPSSATAGADCPDRFYRAVMSRPDCRRFDQPPALPGSAGVTAVSWRVTRGPPRSAGGSPGVCRGRWESQGSTGVGGCCITADHGSRMRYYSSGFSRAHTSQFPSNGAPSRVKRAPHLCLVPNQIPPSIKKLVSIQMHVRAGRIQRGGGRGGSEPLQPRTLCTYTRPDNGGLRLDSAKNHHECIQAPHRVGKRRIA